MIVKESEDATDKACSILEKEGFSYTLISLRKLKEGRIQLEFSVSFFENFDMTSFIRSASENRRGMIPTDSPLM